MDNEEYNKLEIDFDYHKDLLNNELIEEMGLRRIDPNDLIKGEKWVPPEQDKLWYDNYKKNKKYLRPSFSKSKPYKTYILIGGSPAIHRNVHFLNGLEDNFVIISPNTTVKFLLERDIRPDYVFAIEAQSHVGKDFDFDSTGMTLITSPFVCPEALEKWRGDIYTYFLAGGNKYGKAIKKDWGEKINIDIGGGNVVSAAYLWAYRYLQARHFIFMGMSLCYYDTGQYYFDGRTKPKDPLDHWKQFLKAMDMYGDIVTVTPPLIMYKVWLESYSKYAIQYGGGSITNSTEDGVFGVLPNPVKENGNVKLKPTFVPWINICPLYQSINGHRLRMEDEIK